MLVVFLRLVAQNDGDSATHVEALVVVVVVLGRGDAVTGKYKRRLDAGTGREAQRNKGFLQVQLFGVFALPVNGEVLATELCTHHQVKVLKIFAVVAARFQSELAKMVGDVVARPIQLLCSVAATFELIARQELDGLEKLLSRERSSRLRPAKFSKVCYEGEQTYAKPEGGEHPVAAEYRSFPIR